MTSIGIDVFLSCTIPIFPISFQKSFTVILIYFVYSLLFKFPVFAFNFLNTSVEILSFGTVDLPIIVLVNRFRTCHIFFQFYYWFNYWLSFTPAYSRISHEYSSLFIIVINLIFMFSL